MLKKILIAVLAALCLIGTVWVNATLINTRQLTLREEILSSDKIDADTDGLLIAFFSDLDYGHFIDADFLDRTVEEIRSFHPDIIVFGGDLLDPLYANELSQEELDHLMNSLKSLQARYGKYAVYGDDDLVSRDKADYVYTNAGFKVLDNRSQQISIDRNSVISLIGISPLVGGQPDVTTAFSGVGAGHYTIVVSHCPDLFDDMGDHEFSYFLSGHSRGGQIDLPIISLFGRPEGCRKYYNGKITRNGKTLDITNGVGRIDSDARLNADAEIVFYTLKTTALPDQ